MREIKFRAWDKTMSYMDYRVRISHFKDVIEVLDSWSTWRELKKDEYTLMQCTGLKDKNGVEIYEGDLVKVEGMFQDKPFKVWFRNGMYHVGNWNMQGFMNAFDFYEVIGNIYENPELLEERNE